MVQPTVNSEKHYRPISLTTVAENTVFNASVVIAKKVVSDVSSEVRTGSVVKAVYVELWMMSSAAQPTFQVSTIQKISSDGDDPTTTQMSDLYTYPNKKNILRTSQGLVGDSNSNPIPIFRDWVRIPKGKQRFGLGDRFVISVAARGETNNDIEICGIAIYKEYY